jgi:type III pantothenate kinase
VIGTRTEECIRSGVVFGAAESVDGIVRRIKKEWPRKQVPKVVATGGLAPVIKPWCSEIELIEPDLTLHGLRMAYAMLGG